MEFNILISKNIKKKEQKFQAIGNKRLDQIIWVS